MNVKFYVIREGEIIGVADDEEEAEEIINADFEESEAIIRDDYDLDDDTDSEEVAFMAGYDFGCAYYEEIDLDSLDDDKEYTTREGDSFSKVQLEEWL